MKKILAIFLIFTVAVSLLTACKISIGGESSGGGNNSNSGGSGSSGGSKAGDPPNFSEGTEFTAFYNSYDAMNKLYESYFEDSEEYSDNFDYIMANVSRVMLVSGDFLSLMMDDFYADGFYPANHESFPVVSFDFTKSRSGDKVTIAIDSVYKETENSGGYYTNGDHRKYNAVLDKNKLTVSVEDSFSRNGSVYNRSVFEIVRLSDGAYLAQKYTVTKNLDWDTVSSSVGFQRIDKNGYITVIGEFENPDVNFNFTSILDKVDRDPIQMAQNYKVTSIFKVENGKMTFDSKK